MEASTRSRSWLWTTLILSSISIAAFVFAVWELVEYRFFRDTDYTTLHYLYISRGITSSLLLACWAAWFVLRSRRQSIEELRRSRERYRSLLEVSPEAIALYDGTLIVSEWNAAAERLYGFGKQEVIGNPIPTVLQEKKEELRRFLQQVETGVPVLDRETLRQTKHDAPIEVQLSLLRFQDPSGQTYFLEVTADIRERIRLRQTLLEVEKLTTIGKMAAGTAHHLNTPLATMLLRVQMMRERVRENGLGTDLDYLETGTRFCQHFVQRLLEFSRRPPGSKQAEEVTRAIESVVGFLAPSLADKQARISLELEAVAGQRILADRNQFEALLLVLLSNALDAIALGGNIVVRSCLSSRDRIEIQVRDDGLGIAAADLAHVFEPFFTTKGAGRGTGLGLAIARNIVLEHGGSIRLESTPQQGTVAYVELPVWRASPVPEGVAT
ncbi:MAG: PAS domain S-box protein [Acidobacteriales bacterium]|nr:PAS domain S-box protein [Candidatus Koribacter versatilis]MBI3645333.1 PAS domain S-box protein [Terriglobales bacterium]